MHLSPLLKITLIFTLCVILMGAYTRLSDAGLGCPDWPGCYGMLKVPTQAHELSQAERAFPEFTVESDKAWLEMIHRYIAGTLGLLVMMILWLCLKTANAPKNLPLFIGGLVLFQAALGMWTVTMKLMPIVVMSHLLGGFTIISLVLLLYLRTKPLRIIDGDPQAKTLATFSLACLSVLVIQIILGGWTSANYAAMACTALPICEGNWYQNLDFIKAFSPFQGEHSSFEFGVLEYPARMTIHVAHRLWAVVTAIMLVTLAYKLMKRARSATLKQAAWVLLILVGLQIGLGISNVIFHLPLSIAAAHNAGAALLLLSLVFINYALWRKA